MLRSKGAKNSSELANLQEKRNVLAHRILNWQKIQNIYMPSVIQSRSPSDPVEPDPGSDSNTSQVQTEAEKIELFLPSACHHTTPLPLSIILLMAKETQLRIAQAYDALAYIKKMRRILCSISAFKHQNVSGTGNRANTRMRSLYDKFQGRIRVAAARYRAAYDSLLVLDSDGSWKLQLRVLEDGDIRGPKQDTDDEVLGEGTREHSWIWLVGSNVDPQTEDSETKEAMRVEWGKTWARVQRWTEEVRLLQEEMRRVLQFLEWKAQWWRSKASKRGGVDSTLANGLTAYSEKQAIITERLAQEFAKTWSSTLKKQGLQTNWKKKYDEPTARVLWEVERLDSELDEEEQEQEEQDPSDDENLQEEGTNNSDREMQDVQMA